MSGPAPPPSRPGVELLPREAASRARGLPDCPPGTLFVLGEGGGIRVEPGRRFEVVFGRNEPEVHVCVGADDPSVSRRHGVLTSDERGWTLRNLGIVPIRMPGPRLLLTGHEEPLGVGYVPLFIRTGATREHLLELRIAASRHPLDVASPDDATRAPASWRLADRERLVLTALGERYLRHEQNPQPASWSGAAAALVEAQPDTGWTAKSAEWVVTSVKRRLSEAGVAGLTRDEVGEPIGNSINHNLIQELLVTTTLVPPDLRLLEPRRGPGTP